MNTKLHHALNAVTALDQITRRLADVTVSEATRLLQVQADNSDFLQAHRSAQEQVEAAIDEVETSAQTNLTRAVRELRLARQDYFSNVDDNRRNTAQRVAAALRLVKSATTAK